MKTILILYIYLTCSIYVVYATNSSKDLYNKGNQALQDYLPKLAANYFEKALTKTNNPAEKEVIYLALIKAYLNNYNIKKLDVIINKKSLKKNINYAFFYAEYLYLKGKINASLKWYQQVIKQKTSQYKKIAYLQSASIYLTTKKYQLAKQNIIKALTMITNPLIKDKWLINLIQILFKEKEYSTIKLYLTKISHPYYLVKKQYLTAYLAKVNGQYQVAEQILKKIIAESENDKIKQLAKLQLIDIAIKQSHIKKIYPLILNYIKNPSLANYQEYFFRILWQSIQSISQPNKINLIINEIKGLITQKSSQNNNFLLGNYYYTLGLCQLKLQKNVAANYYFNKALINRKTRELVYFYFIKKAIQQKDFTRVNFILNLLDKNTLSQEVKHKAYLIKALINVDKDNKKALNILNKITQQNITKQLIQYTLLENKTTLQEKFLDKIKQQPYYQDFLYRYYLTAIFQKNTAVYGTILNFLLNNKATIKNQKYYYLIEQLIIANINQKSPIVMQKMTELITILLQQANYITYPKIFYIKIINFYFQQQQWQKIIKLYQHIKPEYQTILLQFKIAQAYYYDKQYFKAKLLLVKLNKELKNDSLKDIVSYYIALTTKQENTAQAIEQSYQLFHAILIKKNQFSSLALFEMIHILIKNKEWQQAENLLQKHASLIKQPSLLKDKVLVEGKIYYNQGFQVKKYWLKAIQLYETSKAIDPTNINWIQQMNYLQANIYVLLKEKNKAIELYYNIIQDPQNNYWLWYEKASFQLVDILMQQKLWQASINLLKKLEDQQQYFSKKAQKLRKSIELEHMILNY